MNPHSCIACEADRIPGSGFCQPHKEAHEKSAWVKAWREYQKICAKVGVKNALWAEPKEDK